MVQDISKLKLVIVLWYIAVLASDIGIKLSDIASDNTSKVSKDRKP